MEKITDTKFLNFVKRDIHNHSIDKKLMRKGIRYYEWALNKGYVGYGAIKLKYHELKGRDIVVHVYIPTEYYNMLVAVMEL